MLVNRGASMKCAQCLHEFSDDFAFCPHCGAAARGAATEPAAPEADTPSESQVELPADEPVMSETVEVEAQAAPAETEAVIATPDTAPSDTQAVIPAVVPEFKPAAAAAPVRSAPAEDSFVNAAPSRVVEAPPPKKKRKGHGCLISFGIFLLLIGIALALFFDLPMRLGLVSSPAEKMFTERPNSEARTTLTQEFEQAGQPTQGISFYVLPYKDRGYSLAYVVLDQSKGYRYVDTGFSDPILAAFQLVARSKAVEQAQIYRVSIEFRERDGKTLFVLTAPVFAIQQFAAKTIDRKQFFLQVDGHANLARMIKNQYMLGGSQ
jgi:hypothetical protein